MGLLLSVALVVIALEMRVVALVVVTLVVVTLKVRVVALVTVALAEGKVVAALAENMVIKSNDSIERCKTNFK